MHLFSAFLTSGHSKHFTILLHIHSHIHKPTVVTTMQGNSQLLGGTEGEVSCSGTPQNTKLAGDRTSELLVTSQPALPPEPHASPRIRCRVRYNVKKHSCCGKHDDAMFPFDGVEVKV